MKNIIPHAMAIHDISGVGRCSLTVALPILSAAGIQCSVLPTAVLSTHTGGFTGYTYCDLTDEIVPITNHWKSLKLNFDAIYSGFLGSYEQIGLVTELFHKFKTDDNIIFVDPVMGDNGKLYPTYTEQMALSMYRLCTNADIIVPNITEASILLDQSYREGPYTREYIEVLLKRLALLGPKKIVLTGVYFDDMRIGAACYDADTGIIDYYFSGKVNGFYHGTGDVFGSVLLAGILNNLQLHDAMALAVDFVYKSILLTEKHKADPLYGVLFEKYLPFLIKRLGLDK